MNAVGRLISPADVARRAVYRALAPIAAPLFARRDARVAVLGALIVAMAFASSAVAPGWSLALGPIVLGVPHVLSDVRYLVVRRGLHRRAAVWAAIVPALVAASITGHAWIGFAGVAAAALVARAPLAKRVALAAVAIAATEAARRAGAVADFVVAHLHNVVAVALWWAWRPRRTAAHGLVVAAYATCGALLLAGAADPILRAVGTLDVPGGRLDFGALAAGIAPRGLAGAHRLVLFFAFAQSVHYGVWLRLVPEDDRPRAAPRTFASSLDALVADLGVVPLVVFGALAAGLAAWAAFDLAAARTGYLRAVVFHGVLELAAAALWILEGARGEGRDRPAGAT